MQIATLEWPRKPVWSACSAAVVSRFFTAVSQWDYSRRRKGFFRKQCNVIAITKPGAKGDLMNRKSLPCTAAALFLVIALLAIPGWADDKEKDEDRLQNAGTVLKEILNIPDDIPQDLLDKANCVIVFPSVLKAAFVVGGSYGRGAMTCRKGENFRGAWGAPSMMALEGGSVGFQIGGQATDFVLLVMNDRGANGILSSKVKLGADASVAAGPVGRDASAETDVSMRAEILSYSRARGLFAGISLEGSTIRPDNDANKRIYGEKISAKDIVLANETQIPSAAEGLISSLNSRTPKHKEP
jgi:SH3 domain-containing YSC84-like protein 1